VVASGSQRFRPALLASQNPGRALDGQEIVNSPGSAVVVSAARYYSGSGLLATRTTGGGLAYVGTDAQGTLTATLTTAGVSTRQRYKPFGEQRGGLNALPSERGFVGQVEDTATGLSYLNARHYDARNATFLGVDPVLRLYSPESLNAYIYAGNSPIVFSDPTGLEKGANGEDQSCSAKGTCGSGNASPSVGTDDSIIPVSGGSTEPTPDSQSANASVPIGTESTPDSGRRNSEGSSLAINRFDDPDWNGQKVVRVRFDDPLLQADGIQALAYWYSTGVRFQIVGADKKADLVFRTAVIPPDEDGVQAIANEGNSIITVDPTQWAVDAVVSQRIEILVHEIGHYFGFDHGFATGENDPLSGVMRANISLDDGPVPIPVPKEFINDLNIRIKKAKK
jgi:RHS repeat-associated protein